MDSDAELEAAAWKALERVIDPELGLPITDIGLVYGVAATAGDVTVELTTTTPICPLGDYLTGQAKAQLASLEGVGSVAITLTQDPPWTTDRLSDRARQVLGHPG
jgi:metal-sulfur cluster biosynthetic enzyme